MKPSLAGAAVTSLLALAISGCSSDKGPTVTPSGNDAAQDRAWGITPDATTEPASAAPTAPAGPLAMGTLKKFDTDDPNGTITATVQVISYKGSKYANYQVRVCNLKNSSGGPFTISSNPWSIIYNGDEYSSDESFDGPHPALPEDKILDVGQCAKGWLSFTLVNGKQPIGIDYQGGDGHFQWRNK